jgi:hypothetical protein
MPLACMPPGCPGMLAGRTLASADWGSVDANRSVLPVAQGGYVSGVGLGDAAFCHCTGCLLLHWHAPAAPAVWRALLGLLGGDAMHDRRMHMICNRPCPCRTRSASARPTLAAAPRL